MPAKLDMVIVGSGPGGLTAGILAQKKGLSYVILEKGRHLMQGIIDTYQRAKKSIPPFRKNIPILFPLLRSNPRMKRYRWKPILIRFTTAPSNMV